MLGRVIKGSAVGAALIGVLGVCFGNGVVAGEAETQPVTGKKQAYMGDPARKRGLELGFDRGFLAAKTDQEEGRAPDLGRHRVYHDPDPMYRYEFGNRGVFYHGFRSGFLVGYRQAWGKESVAYVVPQKFPSEAKPGGGPGNGVMAGMEAEILGPGVSAGPGSVSTGKGRAAKPAIPSRVISDAL